MPASLHTPMRSRSDLRRCIQRKDPSNASRPHSLRATEGTFVLPAYQTRSHASQMVMEWISRSRSPLTDFMIAGAGKQAFDPRVRRSRRAISQDRSCGELPDVESRKRSSQCFSSVGNGQPFNVPVIPCRTVTTGGTETGGVEGHRSPSGSLPAQWRTERTAHPL